MISPPKKRKGVRRFLVFLVLLLGIVAVIPHLLVRRIAKPSGGAADAVLVLTGGENRIAEGYRAWKEGKGRELFILGAGRETKLLNILPRGSEVSPDKLLMIAFMLILKASSRVLLA